MLTPAQQAAVKADIIANFAGVPNNTDGAFAIAATYNTEAAGPFYLYRTNIAPQEIFDQVQWSKLTPADTPDGTVTWSNRSLACQGKQFNLQIILQGQTAIDANKSSIRSGLQDALTNVPSAAGGATQAAGWVGVRDTVLARKASRIEKLLNAGGGNGSTPALAATLGFEGPVSYQDIDAARNS